MNPGYARCPLCKRPVKLWSNGRMPVHNATSGNPGGGFSTLAQQCDGSRKRPQEVAE